MVRAVASTPEAVSSALNLPRLSQPARTANLSFTAYSAPMPYCRPKVDADDPLLAAYTPVAVAFAEL